VFHSRDAFFGNRIRIKVKIQIGIQIGHSTQAPPSGLATVGGRFLAAVLFRNSIGRMTRLLSGEVSRMTEPLGEMTGALQQAL